MSDVSGDPHLIVLVPLIPEGLKQAYDSRRNPFEAWMYTCFETHVYRCDEIRHYRHGQAVTCRQRSKSLEIIRLTAFPCKLFHHLKMATTIFVALDLAHEAIFQV